MRCFVLSLHRSGTKSLSALLEQLGLRTIHWPVRHNGQSLQRKIEGRETDHHFIVDVLAGKLAEYQAASDVPIPTLYKVLYDRYPDAKFILLRREAADWVRSVRNSIGDRPFRAFERVQYWHYFPDRPAHIKDISDADLAGMYQRHTAEVLQFFDTADRSRLAVLDLTNPDCGQKVAAFLGINRQAKLPHASEKPRTRLQKVRLRLMRAGTKLRLAFPMSG